MSYEQFPLGGQYFVGANLTDGDIYSELTGFQWDNGIWTNGGIATVVNTNMARGSGQEVNLNNINQRFIFNGVHPNVATFKYADWGGNVNLGINGVLRNVGDFSSLNGSIVAGVQIIVTRTNVAGGHYGTVVLIGVTNDIDRFAFGGQEFWADDVCVQFP